ncbi:hypothetical protein L195_g038752 [Trifolium pratense]|uniref:Uncharacterized protein n=1 Tax=Trifolium pratense TaxID=57577 RepID=A0A2K3LW31_TRIPR|nr:hypothetical protein L195_g038752 [Trifolium pratense]
MVKLISSVVDQVDVELVVSGQAGELVLNGQDQAVIELVWKNQVGVELTLNGKLTSSS